MLSTRRPVRESRPTFEHPSRLCWRGQVLHSDNRVESVTIRAAAAEPSAADKPPRTGSGSIKTATMPKSGWPTV